MNFLDTYDISASSGGSSTPVSNQPQQSLNEEVNQVIGQLGRFWGGFRKQSQTVFETARKDLGDVVNQAQRELSKLKTSVEGSNTEGSRSGLTEDAELVTPTASSTTLNEDSARADESSATTPSQNQSGWNTQALFARLQSALPPNVVSAVQSHIPESIKHASENIDLAQIRTNLLSEVQRIQGVTRAQAEEYVHKSEALLREAVKEAQEVLKDAVKVIPPDEVHAASTTSGVIWDGTDVWMLPEDSETGSDAITGSGKGKAKSTDAGVAAVTTRAEALLKRLRQDPAIARLDPVSDGASRELYKAWLEKEVHSKESGMEGEEWRATIAKNLDDPANGETLASLKNTLVPSELTETEFWQRFFFRTHQIKEEEEKRKALLQATTESEDDFDWDDEDSDEEEEEEEEETKVTPAKEATPTRSPAPPPKQSSASAQQESTAPTRESSLDSYDVVSSANASTAGEGAKHLTNAFKESDEDDDEEDDESGSDWE